MQKKTRQSIGTWIKCQNTIGTILIRMRYLKKLKVKTIKFFFVRFGYKIWNNHGGRSNNCIDYCLLLKKQLFFNDCYKFNNDFYSFDKKKQSKDKMKHFIFEMFEFKLKSLSIYKKSCH